MSALSEQDVDGSHEEAAGEVEFDESGSQDVDGGEDGLWTSERPSRGTGQISTVTWDCTVCTFTNSPSAFKCAMCDVRKGTSTRKSRLSDDILAGQQSMAYVASVARVGKRPSDPDTRRRPACQQSRTRQVNSLGEEDSRITVQALTDRQLKALYYPQSSRKPTAECGDRFHRRSAHWRMPRLKNIDRSTGITMLVTVGDLTVHITEFKPLPARSRVTTVPMDTETPESTQTPEDSIEDVSDLRENSDVQVEASETS